MSRGVSSKGSVPSDYEFSMYNVYCTALKWVEKGRIITACLRYSRLSFAPATTCTCKLVEANEMRLYSRLGRGREAKIKTTIHPRFSSTPLFLTPPMKARLIKVKGERFRSILNDCVDYFVPIVLKPLSAECHVVMDQSSDVVLDTPKVKLCPISNFVLRGYHSNVARTVCMLLGAG